MHEGWTEVTSQEKKKVLRSYRQLMLSAKAYRQALAELDEWCLPQSPKLDGMPHGATQTDLTAVVIRREKLAGDYARRVDECAAKAQKILDAIDGMSDEREKTLLRLRYIDGLSFERMAVDMGLSYRSLTRLHGGALSHFEVVE